MSYPIETKAPVPTHRVAPWKSPSGNRFAITDSAGTVVDTAQGYGYKTFDKALAALRYKFGGGRERAEDAERTGRKALKDWKAAHPGIDLKNLWEAALENGFKDLARGDLQEADLWCWVESDIKVAVPYAVRRFVSK